MISINLGEIPDEGLHLAGETTEDIFQLEPTEEDAFPSGPVKYDLFVSNVGSEMMLAQGSLIAPFFLKCVSCLEKFPFTVKLEEYAADFDIPADGDLDMTERIREDLLLELPGYPHCDRDNDDPDHLCPAAGKFDAPEGLDPSEAGPSAWDALDELKEPES